MIVRDFVERNDVQYASQLTHFAARLSNYLTQLSLVTADVTAATNDAAFFRQILTFSQTVSAYSKDLVKSRKQIRSGVIIGTGPAGLIVLDPGAGVTSVAPGIDKRFRALAARIKAHPNYSTSIGADLGIEGVHSAPAAAPTGLVGVASPHGIVKLTFKKLGHPGVSIESQRGAETSSTVLANPLRSPYVDARANLVSGVPEVRKYKYRYVDVDGVPTGGYSDVLEMTTEP